MDITASKWNALCTMGRCAVCMNVFLVCWKMIPAYALRLQNYRRILGRFDDKLCTYMDEAHVAQLDL